MKPASRHAEMIVGLLTLPAFLLAWELVSRFVVDKPKVFPPASAALLALGKLVADGTLFMDALVSVARVLTGFALGAAAGIVLGIWTSRSRLAYASVGQLLRLLRNVSPVVLVPFSIVWFEYSEVGKSFIIVWGVVFVVWINAHVGMSSIDNKFLWAAASLGIPERTVAFKIAPLAALPVVLAGARSALGIAMICVVVAEMSASGATQGLGYRVSINYQIFRVDQMMAALCVLALVGFALDRVFVRVCRWRFPWVTWNL
jgi:ABC-type nitrate/sulfonate/bicarbonate transport system permease component